MILHRFNYYLNNIISNLGKLPTTHVNISNEIIEVRNMSKVLSSKILMNNWDTFSTSNSLTA